MRDRSSFVPTNLAAPPLLRRLVRHPPPERDIIEVSLIEELGPLVDRDGEVSNGFQNFNSVSEIVSREIGRDATFAVLAAAGAILLYITFQFRNVPKAYRYGFAALLAVGHDTLIILGVFSILGKAFDIEINTMFITGLLTIIGFSVHDTIVVFDRIEGERDPESEYIVRSSCKRLPDRDVQPFSQYFHYPAVYYFGASALGWFQHQ